MSLSVNEQALLLKRYGFDDSDPILDWLNASMHDIETYEDWTWLEAHALLVTVASQNSVASPVNLAKIVSFRDTSNNTKLTPKLRQTFDREYLDPTVTGKPRHYILTGLTTIQLYPVPDAIYNLDMYHISTISDVVLGSQPPSIPPEFHYPMVLNAAYIALMAENEEERAQAAQKQFEAMMLKLMDRYGTRHVDDPDTVTDFMEYSRNY